MARNNQEWDYPPKQRRYRSYSVLDAAPDGEGWASPTTTRAVNVYWRVLKTLVKFVLGALIAAAMLALIWLASAILKT